MGINDYREGRYAGAIRQLTAAARPASHHLVRTLAQHYLAMARHRLGQQELARAHRTHLHKLLDQPRGMKDAEALDLMREAQALIAPPRATTER